MLRRIHDPDRGANLLEYGAVIVLCVALLAALIGSGLIGTVSQGVQSAVQQLFDPDSVEDGDGGSQPPSDDGDGSDGDEGGGDDGPGGGATDRPQASDDGGGGGGFLDGVTSAAGDFWDGATSAAGNLVEDGKESLSDAWEGVQDFADDPGQWVEDTWNGTVDGAEEIWQAAQDDPGQLVVDFFASPEAQERCSNADYFGCGGMVVVENAESLIPVWGWNKKRERLSDMADAARETNRRNDDNVQADGLPDDDARDRDRTDDEGSPCACNCPNSFVPGTLVLSGDGGLVPIEDIRTGDSVWAFDPVTGREGPKEVLAVIDDTGDKPLVDITIRGDHGGGELTATEGHPFWLPERAEWAKAGDLEPGTWLRTSSGTWAQITAVEHDESPAQRVHNLTVEGLHTYFAVAGDEPLLVHNDNERESSCPEWLREQREKGNEFNREREPYYTERGGANEVHVGERTSGGQYMRVDSYIPGEEIVSRKYTQLGGVQESTAVGYLRELSNHYGPGTVIADTPSNRRDLGDDAAGSELDGDMILEVPPQEGPVPQSVLDEADRLDITIRDSEGKEYN